MRLAAEPSERSAPVKMYEKTFVKRFWKKWNFSGHLVHRETVFLNTQIANSEFDRLKEYNII